MDEILKYVSLITVVGAGISFVVSLLKWFDQRKKEQEDKHYESFHRMVCLASGVNDSGVTIKQPQQVAAVYQLQRYSEYKFASVPVLEMLQERFKQPRDQHESDKHLLKAISETLKVLTARTRRFGAIRYI